MAITKGNDYDKTESFGSGFKSLPNGGYVCKIIKAEETKSKTGKDMVHIAFDIAEGDYKDYFRDLFNKRKDRADDPLNVKFPFEGQMWIPVNDYEDQNKTSRKFKGFCTALEESGTRVWNDRNEFMIDTLNGALIGIVYQNQEQEYQGKTSWRAIPWGCRSTDSIRGGDFFVPEDKPLSVADTMPEGFQKIQDSEIPF